MTLLPKSSIFVTLISSLVITSCTFQAYDANNDFDREHGNQQSSQRRAPIPASFEDDVYAILNTAVAAFYDGEAANSDTPLSGLFISPRFTVTLDWPKQRDVDAAQGDAVAAGEFADSDENHEFTQLPFSIEAGFSLPLCAKIYAGQFPGGFRGYIPPEPGIYILVSNLSLYPEADRASITISYPAGCVLQGVTFHLQRSYGSWRLVP